MERRLHILVALSLAIATFTRPISVSAVEVQQESKSPLASEFDFSNSADIQVPKLSDPITHIPENLKIWADQILSPESLPGILGVTAMTGAMIATDYESWQMVRKPFLQSDRFHDFCSAGVSMGDGFFQFGIVGGFLAASAISPNKRALRTAAQITESILSTGIIVQLIKRTTGRESPFSSEERTGRWRPFPNQLEYNKDFQKFDAVPSGHLSTAVTTYMVIEDNYPHVKWLPYVGYPVLGWIAVGLVGTSIHWWSDFPIAAALGYQFAKIVTRGNHPELQNSLQNKSYLPNVSPVISATGDPMLNLRWDL